MIGRHLAVEPLLRSTPNHWNTQRFKSAVDRVDRRNVDVSQPMMSLKSSGDVVRRDTLGQRQEPNERSLPRYLVAEPGDLIVNPMWLIGGAIGVTRHAGAVSPDYRVFRLRKHHPRYLHYLVRTPLFIDQYRLYTRAQTTFDRRVQQPDLDNLPLPVPPIDEQRAIADHLDREIAQIDALIAKQQTLIDTLRERRAATVRTALLGGFDNRVTHRSSGVDALGDIPVHWDVIPTRFLCSISTGGEDSGNATDEGDYPFFVRGRGILRSDHYSFDCEAVMTPGDGQGGTGKVFHYFNGRFQAHQRVYVFHRFKRISGWYFYHYVSTFLRDVALAGSNTVTMESLRRPLLAGFPVAVPPQDEQQRITEHLDEQTAKIDTLVAKTERFVELAIERRTALITAAVTGQLDLGATA